MGSGAGSVGSSSYGGGGGGYSQPSEGVGSKIYSPYQNSDAGEGLNLNSKSTGNAWGPQKEGSTFNITNNNNINYNYGSNITAISSEGSVPTFQEMEK
jgi:hypothetical protein